jgi:hypothetical protein
MKITSAELLKNRLNNAIRLTYQDDKGAYQYAAVRVEQKEKYEPDDYIDKLADIVSEKQDMPRGKVIRMLEEWHRIQGGWPSGRPAQQAR